MNRRELLKNDDFREVTEVKADSKNRISLGRNVALKVQFYKVYQNALGQIVLDPQVTVPAHEGWLFKNQEALKMVRRGLTEAKSRKLRKAKEDYSKYTEGE